MSNIRSMVRDLNKNAVSLISQVMEKHTKAILEETRDTIKELQAGNVIAAEALEKLACLGNGDRHGNSIGNKIAIDALKLLEKQPPIEGLDI